MHTPNLPFSVVAPPKTLAIKRPWCKARVPTDACVWKRERAWERKKLDAHWYQENSKQAEQEKPQASKESGV